MKGKLTYGVFAKGETLVSPRVVEDHLCEPETWNTNKCLFLESDFLYDIQPSKEAILVVELQVQGVSLEGKMGVEVYGWTMLELFDMKKELLRGKFKVPFYSTKTNPNMLVDELKALKSISNSLLYLRVAFPNDKEYGVDDPVDPQEKVLEYFVPFIHRKTEIRFEDMRLEPKETTGRWLPVDHSMLVLNKRPYVEEEPKKRKKKKKKEKKVEEPIIEEPEPLTTEEQPFPQEPSREPTRQPTP